MSGVIDMLASGLGTDAVDAISQNLGIDKDKASVAVSGAIPMLVKALARNTEDEKGAESLFNTLEKKHDGSVLDDIAGYLNNADIQDGGKILKHVLGGQRGAVEKGLGSLAGLNASQVGSVLATLAPLVLGALSRSKGEQSLDAGGLADLLRSESKTAEKKAPDAMGVLGKLLDADGDGSIADDVADIGMKLLKGFLK
ncbi:MAG: DUF937 domain-containing protein [Spirochaetes bacterium]|nr:DUF937 domain-containing protein [Spirochaetota bacterium]